LRTTLCPLLRAQVIAMEQNAQAQAKPIKIPGPEHPISVERNSSRVVVSVAGRVIADTSEALTLHEAHYPAVQYIPARMSIWPS
jgi:uncharacterized protein (DUF427 family)